MAQPPENINISNGLLFDGEPYLAVNPTNPQNLVAAWMSLQFSGGLRIGIKTRATFDGGDTWSAAKSIPHNGTGYGSADVSMAFDKNEVLYLAYIDYRQSPDSGGIYVVRSVDGGLSWDEPSKAFDMYDVAGKRPIDRPWLVVDQSDTPNSGTLYITTKPAPWIAPPNRNYFKSSTDQGHTWTTIANVDGGNYLVGNVIAAPMASPGTTIDGHFCAVYPSYVLAQNPLPAFYFAESSDRGQHFSYSTLAAAIPAANDTNYKNGYLLLANPVDSNRFIFLTPDAHNGDADIMAFHSEDGGQSWSDPVRVNDDAVANGKGQDMVWGSYNESGDLVVTWRDRRDAPADGFWNAGYDFYYATSADNGVTFSANQKLSSQFIAFDSVLTQNGNDFMSCAYVQDTLYTVWGDTRSSRMNIYFAKTIASTGMNVGTVLLEGEGPQWKIFPNPARDQVNAAVPAELLGQEISIHDVSGKMIFTEKVNERLMEIQTGYLVPGIYFVRIGDEIQRLVVE